MTITIQILSAAIGGAFLGVVILQLVQRSKAQNKIKKSEQQAKRILKKHIRNPTALRIKCCRQKSVLLS